MALLVEAIRASNNESAHCQLSDGTLVLVQRVLGREEPYAQEEYVLELRSKNRPPVEHIAANDLLELMQRMGDLLPGVDPEGNEWLPGGATGLPDVEGTPGTEVAQVECNGDSRTTV